MHLDINYDALKFLDIFPFLELNLFLVASRGFFKQALIFIWFFFWFQAIFWIFFGIFRTLLESLIVVYMFIFIF